MVNINNFAGSADSTPIEDLSIETTKSVVSTTETMEDLITMTTESVFHTSESTSATSAPIDSHSGSSDIVTTGAKMYV